MKKTFALVGHPITHTISPFIHNRLFELSKISADYTLLDVTSNNLSKSMDMLNSFDGYNVTIPHKQNIVQFLDKLYDKAKIYECVNTVKNSALCATGYNTDANGFLYALKFEKLNLNGDITILGCGGVAKIVCFEAALKGCHVTLAVRKYSFEKAKILANHIKEVTKKIINVTFIDKLPQKIDLLINATPVGMFPNINETPISDLDLKRCQNVFDAVYNPFETKFIKKATANGAKAASGLSMLVYQACFSHKIWNQSVFAESEIQQLIYDSKEELKKFV